MATLVLDPRFSFENFVVGTANRLAAAAAKRVAEAPGRIYNPLFIYSGSGLGKTHLVTALGHLARRLHPDVQVEYDTLERFMDGVLASVEAGERDAFFHGRIQVRGVLILDDVQFLADRHRTQEELLRVWDLLAAAGTHIILASDRPPHEIDQLDQRLLTRVSGGLIVDMGAPDYETRVAILRRKLEEQKQELGAGVAESLARLSFGNVRELQGALNRILAVQELEQRVVAADDVETLIGYQASESEADEFRDFLEDISETVEEVVTRAPGERQLADAILRWEADGFRTRRLEAALEHEHGPGGIEPIIRGFEADVERLREITGEIGALDPHAPELRRRELLMDPDRITEVEALLADVRERTLPFREPPAGPDLDALELPGSGFALRAARAAIERPGTRYSPLFVHGEDAATRTRLLAAIARALRGFGMTAPVAYVEGRDFAFELIRALEHNRVEVWRQRYRRAGALVIDEVDGLAGTERAQEELFHLFEALQRTGAQLVFAAADPPATLTGLEDRLRTRLASGLVVDLENGTTPADALAAPAAAGTAPAEVAIAVLEPEHRDEPGREDPLFRSAEKIAWRWPYLDDLLLEAPD
ncbi:MAG: DnaA ATPase domain-containing protein [Longimicrobiales bacterium]